MGDTRQRSGRPWWVPVLGFVAIFGAFVRIARAPDEADSAASAPRRPSTLAEAGLVRRPADGSAQRVVLLLHGSGSSSGRAVDGIERAWTAASEPVWIDRHPGSHGPPDDMRKRFDSALTWMQVKASS